VPLPQVEVERWLLFVDAEDKGHIYWRGLSEPRKLPDEWVLRQLRDADLDDYDAIAALIDEYGAISWPYFMPAHVPSDRVSLLGHLPTKDEIKEGQWWENAGPSATIEDVRWWLKTVRALAGMWAQVSTGGNPALAWTNEGLQIPLYGLRSEVERHCWTYFSLAMDAGLRAFHARVEYRATYPGDFAFTYSKPRVGLYSAACSQIFNLIAKEDRARRCENETCGRVFVHQLGGAKYGQHRTKGVLRFCTPACAQAETQRQYRRRKAAKEKGKKP
jgi:hypothetical protein